MEEFKVPNLKPSFLQMNSSNMHASFEGYMISNVHGTTNDQFSVHHHHQMSYDNQRSTAFDPMMMPHLFPSGYECNTVSSDPEIILKSSSSGFLGHHMNKDNKKHQEQSTSVGKKRKRGDERESDQKPKDVIHVRAKRGQATDSHSLAERLRREKINEKMKSLQDLVPGCYKTMGMAVMLDVIMNYIRSLQNQIDFLSMKLSAASLVYDFNSSEAEAMEAMQAGSNGYEAAQVIEKLVVGDGYGGISHFQTTAAWPL